MQPYGKVSQVSCSSIIFFISFFVFWFHTFHCLKGQEDRPSLALASDSELESEQPLGKWAQRKNISKALDILQFSEIKCLPTVPCQ